VFEIVFSVIWLHPLPWCVDWFFWNYSLHIPTGMPTWRPNWRVAITARSACAGFVITTVFTDIDWLWLQAQESATIYNCPRWKGRHTLWIWGGWSCVTVSGDLSGLMSERSDLKLETFRTWKTSGRQRRMSGGVRLWTEDAFGTKDNFRKVVCGGGSQMNSGSFEFLSGSS